jgi:hypothetical protein
LQQTAAKFATEPVPQLKEKQKMKINREETHDPQAESSGVEASTPYTAPTEADKNTDDQPLIGDCVTAHTSEKPIC